MEPAVVRCAWPGLNDPLYAHYHDTEWGVPQADDQRLFEKLILEGFQAGLSWLTILKKRETFRAAFHGFDAQVMARYDANDIARVMRESSVIV
jgi:DNA-3-methyladenine glycosylase I